MGRGRAAFALGPIARKHDLLARGHSQIAADLDAAIRQKFNIHFR